MHTGEINSRRNKIIASNIPADKKQQLLDRLDRLQPEQSHCKGCDCDSCSAEYASIDEAPTISDPTIFQVFQNFTNPIIPRIMNKKVTAFIVIGVGIAIAFVGFKMYRKIKSSSTAQ